MTLDDYLKTRSISGPDFAARIGVDPATVYRIRKGRVLPHRRTILSIIEATEGLVGLSDLLVVDTNNPRSEPAERPPKPSPSSPRILSVLPQRRSEF